MSIIGRLGLRAIDVLVGSRDYEVRQIGQPPRGFNRFLAFAKRCGIAPKTVYDVGVGFGTPWLYEAFPESGFVLVEAQERFRSQVERAAKMTGGEVVMSALGRAPGKLKLRVPQLLAEGASINDRSAEFLRLETTASRNVIDEFTEVSTTTLDAIAVHPSPYVVKIDVEGAEMDVLAGGREAMQRTELLLLEMSVLHRFAGEPSFAERIAFLDQLGFELFDIPDLSQTSTDGPLSFIDAAFVRKDRRPGIPSW